MLPQSYSQRQNLLCKSDDCRTARVVFLSYSTAQKEGDSHSHVDLRDLRLDS